MRLKVDKNLGLSSYFLYRYGFNEDISISDKYPNHIEDITIKKKKKKNSNDLEIALKNKMDEATADGKAALALSGGIDSAILAKFMPEGSIAYTFRCIVPGVKVTDESPRAAHHAKYCNLEHRIIDITWEDIEETLVPLMKHKGGPIHSIESQIYMGALKAKEDGFVIPYADLPLDEEQVGESVYMAVANYAKDYAWYVTPYLILTDEMIHTLGLAAKQGVDVRVITPGIPDKKMVYSITRSYYNSLVRNGVRIFEYTPGFCHAKMSIADDRIATCGTINLDYRSLYHHFENGCLFMDYEAVGKVKEDFENMMAQSREVTEDYRNPRAGRKLLQLFLRLFAPFL